MEFELKTGFKNMDIIAIHNFLSNHSYWAKQIPLHIVYRSMKNSFCVGVFKGDEQVAFARIITDYATFAYLADVYVLEPYRARGLSKIMMKHMMQLEWVQQLRRCMLATLDAHSLYAQFGFNAVEKPERLMEICKPNSYQKE